MEPTDEIVQEAVAPVQTEVQTDVITAPSAEVEETPESTITPKTSKEETGQIAAIKAEREKRQAMEKRAEILEQEVTQLRQQSAQQHPRQTDPFEGLTDEDIVNVKSVKDYVKSVKDEVKSSIDTFRINQSTRIAKQNHSDFEDVIKELPKVANQTQIGFILSSDDPAETAYMFIKGSPQYVDALTKDTVTKTAQQTIDTINQHSKKVKTLSNSGAGTAKPAKRIYTSEEINQIDAAISMGNTEVLKKFGLA
jgi:predicted SnoaL-like aldol condensation-catalyzing enzyme